MSIYGSERVDAGTISKIVKLALDRRFLSEDSPTAVFFDLPRLKERLAALSRSFPEPALNAVATKACPAIGVLRVAARQGFGAECASKAELLIAQRAGFPANKIVYDSPTKTTAEIKYAMKAGMYLNVDNEQELSIIGRLASGGFSRTVKPLGLRINPELSLTDFDRLPTPEEGRTITGLRSSKFGVPLRRARELLIGDTHLRDLVAGLHVHIGSQSCPPNVIIKGIRRVVELADILNMEHGYSINTIDIGGGLAVRYRDGDSSVSFEEFSENLFSSVPRLREYRVITEFGRALFAGSGWVVSRVEYTKKVKDEDGNELNIAAIQTGGDMFVRTAYMDWYHDVIVLDAQGSVKTGEALPQDIAGPLCFSGDFIGHRRLLPPIDPQDWIVIRESGAYTFGMWSHYNSRAFPPIYAYDEHSTMSVLHKGYSSEEMANFWQ